MTSTTPTTGWWNPNPNNNRSKWHYIGTNGKSACGRHLYVSGYLEQGQDDSPENCRTCRQILETNTLLGKPPQA